MKQTEKLDIILEQLYNFRFDGRFHNIKSVLSEAGCDVNRQEAFALAKRLDDEGLIKMISSKDDVSGEITSQGVEYCETDSHTHEGSAVINNNYEIKIENSPGANLVNQSQNVSISNQVNDIEEILSQILKKIDRDENLDEKRKEEIRECAREIQNNLETGTIPKFGIKSLLSLLGDISSVSSLAMSLGQMI